MLIQYVILLKIDMVEYGYINERGCLTSKMLEQRTERFQDYTGEIKDRIITVERQARELELLGWKPVDLIDETQLQTDEFCSVELLPHDTGERICYTYNKIPDLNALRKRIESLIKQLSGDKSPIGDYRITKCYEASLLGKALPYDIESLYTERQKVRDEINQLQELITSME